MIRLTKLDGTETVVNCDQILQVEKTPDTMLLLSNGMRLMVAETVDEVVARAIDFRRRVLRGPIVAVHSSSDEEARR